MFIANSLKQPLDSHLLAVGNTAEAILNELSFDDVILAGHWGLVVKLTGFYHDLGKVDPFFQDYIGQEVDYQGQNGEKAHFALEHPLHHEWSLLLLIATWKPLKKYLQHDYPALQQQSLTMLFETIKYAVYWHHAEQVRELTLEDVIRNTFSAHPKLANELTVRTNHIFESVFKVPVVIDDEDIFDALEKIREIRFIDLAGLKQSSLEPFSVIRATIEQNAAKLISRYCLIAADRLVSARSPFELASPITLDSFNDDNLLLGIKSYIDRPDYAGIRTDKQIQSAQDLAQCGTNTLVGPAGSGKTRVALMDYFYSRTLEQSIHKGIVWAVPRVVVGLGVLEEIRQECPTLTVSILSGQHKGTWQGEAEIEVDPLSADIVIMTIDQIAKRLTRHGVHDEFGVFLSRFVVFDEYHELFAISSLYWISLLLMKMKEWQVNGHRFVSATPEPFHLKLVTSSDHTYDEPIILESFNSKPITISFIDSSDLAANGSIYVFNTATKAQNAAIQSYQSQELNFDCFHSKYTTDDKETLTRQILASFGKGSADQSRTLYAGPIAQAALNISRQTLTTEATTPANLLQRVGRCNRFAEHDQAHFNVLVDSSNVTEKRGQYGYFGQVKNTGLRKLKFVNDTFVETNTAHFGKLAYDFMAMLKEQLGGDKQASLVGTTVKTTMNELMALYMAFWRRRLSQSEEKLNEFFEYVLEAADLLKVLDTFKPTKRIVADKTGAIEVVVSYRGDSKYGTALHCNLGSQGWNIGAFISSDDHMRNLISLTYNDYSNIDIVSNLAQSPHSALLELNNTLKYRAKARGMSESDILISMASNPAYPLVCSNQMRPMEPSLFYLSLGVESPITIGYRTLKKGMDDLMNLLVKDME